MRKIDIFTHIYPRAFYDKLMRVAGDFKDVGKRSRGVPMLYDLDERFRVMDRFADYQQVLSLPTPPLEAMGNQAEAADLARLANDGMAELVVRYPDRFAGFVASLPYNDPDAAVREARRAVDDLGANSCRSSKRWPATICRSGCTLTVERRGATIRPKLPLNSKSGGRSDGRTRPAWPWPASCSRVCSIAFRR